MLASVVICTRDRANALASTLEALVQQDLPAGEFEVLVIDDGSTDATAAVLESISVPFTLRSYRLAVNQGTSAARNVGLREARGRFLILLSDDVVVPANFIRAHLATLEAVPNAWVVGSCRQLPSLTNSPFGRYLDQLERGFERARLSSRIEEGLFEMTVPTARNLSLRRADLDRTGLFDERFRRACDDEDLGRRAREHGIRFVYNAAIECVHNDQSADLKAYCVFQQRGAQDVVRLADKHPGVDDRSPIVRENGYLVREDGASLALRKLVKRALATPPAMRLIEDAVAAGERWDLPDAWLFRGYRLLIGLHIFRGFREGLRETGRRPQSGA